MAATRSHRLKVQVEALGAGDWLKSTPIYRILWGATICQFCTSFGRLTVLSDWPSRRFRLPFQLPRNPARGRIIAFQAGKQFWLDGAHHVGANSKCPTALGRLHRLRHEDGANSSRARRSPNRLHLPMPIEAPPKTSDPRRAEPASQKPRWRVLEAFVVNQVAASPQNASAGRFLSHGGACARSQTVKKKSPQRGGGFRAADWGVEMEGGAHGRKSNAGPRHAFPNMFPKYRSSPKKWPPNCDAPGASGTRTGYRP
jgi:hypothetical protein